MPYRKNNLRILSSFLLIVVILLIPSCSSAKSPKNIILMIGDGMGTGHLMATRISQGGPGHKLTIDALPHAAFVTTYSANSLVTDSAAAATALACGVKTNNGMLGVAPDNSRLKSILEAAEGIGKSTGLVTTVTLTHATPAGFAAHVDNRGKETIIAEQYADSDVEVLLGGGRANFVPQDVQGSNRKDSRNIVDLMKAKGYAYAQDKTSLSSTESSKILGLFWTGYRAEDPNAPSLVDMTEKAIQTLSKDKDGFFLMVEGGQIDSKAHGNDIAGVVAETVEFDQAVSKALDFAKKDGNTLVVVTADHETGGLAIKDDGMKLAARWVDTGHTGNPVQLYAYGPESEQFDGFMDNTDIPKKFAGMWKVGIGK